MSYEMRFYPVGDLIGTSFRVGGRFFKMILACTALSSLLAPVNELLSARMTQLSSTFSSNYSLAGIGQLFAFLGIYILFLFVLTAVSYFFQAFMIGEINRYMVGESRPFNAGKSLGETLRVWIPCLLAGMLSTLIIVFGCFLLLVPGLIFVSALSVVIPAAVCEKRGVIGSLERSWNLTKNLRLRIFGTLLLVGLVNLVIILIPLIIFETLKKRVLFPFQYGNVIQTVVLSYLKNLIYGTVGSLLGIPASLIIFNNCRLDKEGAVSENITADFEKPMPGAEL